MIAHPEVTRLVQTDGCDDDGCIETNDVDEDTGKQTFVERCVERPTAFRRWAVAMVKAEVGTVRKTEANRLMVSKIIRDILSEHGVRKSHWHLHLPVIEALYFVPDNAQLEARSLMGSPEVKRREALMRGGVTTWFCYWFYRWWPSEYQA